MVRGALDKSRLRRFVVWIVIVFVVDVPGRSPEWFPRLFGVWLSARLVVAMRVCLHPVVVGINCVGKVILGDVFLGLD